MYSRAVLSYIITRKVTNYLITDQGNNNYYNNYETFPQKNPRKFAGFKKTLYLCSAFSEKHLFKDRDLAQLVAHTSGGREAAGSSPVIPTKGTSKPLVISSLDCFYALNWRVFTLGEPKVMKNNEDENSYTHI